MTGLTDLLQEGAGHAWLYIPSAIALGALHGLEPGHSKTMMAAFIVAIRGTVTQAVLLGLSATLSHTAVVWLVAIIGMHYGGQLNAERTEPYFQLASAVLIIAVALWMIWRVHRDQKRERLEADHVHHHHGAHDHASESRRIETGHHQDVLLEIFEEGVPPRFRLRFESHEKSIAPPPADSVIVETDRPDGATQAFVLVARDGFLESVEAIPEPHAFMARVKMHHGGHSHDYDVEFAEEDHTHDHAPAHDHGHDPHHSHDQGGLDVSAVGYQDAHERAHANDIKRRFGNRDITTGQIIVFGLTGGLIPCPASITVLLLCLQLKKFTLGMTLVLCFSIGLAMTMVLSGTLAALSVRHVSKRWSGFGTFAPRAPYASSALIIVVGLYTGYLGWHALPT